MVDLKNLSRKSEEYQEWRREVYKRDNYICQCCGAKHKRVNAHHLNGFNWCIKDRIRVSNGITLCDDCHNHFHSIFGRGNNTKEQFDKYILAYFGGTLESLQRMRERQKIREQERIKKQRIKQQEIERKEKLEREKSYNENTQKINRFKKSYDNNEIEKMKQELAKSESDRMNKNYNAIWGL